MTNINYRGFEIDTTVGTEDTGKPYYGYQIRGSGLLRPIETNERLGDAGTALALAKDFIDEHLA